MSDKYSRGGVDGEEVDKGKTGKGGRDEISDR